jgi:multiple sugar transport system substrate-binding protein
MRHAASRVATSRSRALSALIRVRACTASLVRVRASIAALGRKSAYTAVLALALAASACGRDAVEPPKSELPPPLTLRYDHLRHLGLDVTVAGQAVRAVALYADAPDYTPSGSPERDGFEGIACVDDAARAAVVYLRAYEESRDSATREEALGLLRFIVAMEQGNGEFVNFIDPQGRLNRVAPSSRESMSYWAARAIWAMSEGIRVLGRETPDRVAALRAPLARAEARMAQDIDAGRLIGESSTATSEALFGLLAMQRAEPTPARAALATRTAQLIASLSRGSTTTAPWGAHTDSPSAPWHAWGARSVAALATASIVLERPEFLAAAKREADALWSRFMLAGQFPAEVAPDGAVKWFPQIAYAISPIVEGYLAIAEATNDRRYAVLAGLAGSWLLASTPAGTLMYHEKTGRTFDGIDSPTKVNQNSGAESTIESLLALQRLTRSADASEYLHYRVSGAPSTSLANVPGQREYTGPGARKVTLRLGVGGLEVAASHGRSPIALTYWPAANPFETRLAIRITDQWNRENPDIQVRVQPLPAGRSTEEVLLAAIVARATPDVSSNVSSALLSRLVRAGGVVRLDNLGPTSARMAERTTGPMLSSLRFPDGGIYAMPWKTNPEMLMYNIDLLKAAGIDPPQTHTELLDAFRKLARDTDGDGRLDRWALWAPLKVTWYERFFDFYPLYLASSGGTTLVSNGEVLFENEAAVAAIELLRKGFAEGLLPKANFALGRDPFMDGTVAMKIIGCWILPELEQLKTPGLRYAVAPMPMVDGGSPTERYAFADMRSIAIFSTTKHVDAAARFVAYLTSPAADRMLIEEASQLPYRRELASDGRFTAALQKWPTLPSYAAQVERVRDLDLDPDVVEIFDLISEAYEASGIYGKTPVREALARAAAEAKKVMDAR